MYRDAGKFMRNIHLTQFSRQLLSEKKSYIQVPKLQCIISKQRTFWITPS